RMNFRYSGSRPIASSRGEPTGPSRAVNRLAAAGAGAYDPTHVRYLPHGGRRVRRGRRRVRTAARAPLRPGRPGAHRRLTRGPGSLIRRVTARPGPLPAPFIVHAAPFIVHVRRARSARFTVPARRRRVVVSRGARAARPSRRAGLGRPGPQNVPDHPGTGGPRAGFLSPVAPCHPWACPAAPR